MAATVETAARTTITMPRAASFEPSRTPLATGVASTISCIPAERSRQTSSAA